MESPRAQSKNEPEDAGANENGISDVGKGLHGPASAHSRERRTMPAVISGARRRQLPLPHFVDYGGGQLGQRLRAFLLTALTHAHGTRFDLAVAHNE
jgi:hypothetical protein